MAQYVFDSLCYQVWILESLLSVPVCTKGGREGEWKEGEVGGAGGEIEIERGQPKLALYIYLSLGLCLSKCLQNICIGNPQE